MGEVTLWSKGPKMTMSAHWGWGGPPMSDNDLMKEGVRRDDQCANTVDEAMPYGGSGIHNQLCVLPAANVLNGLPRLCGYNRG